MKPLFVLFAAGLQALFSSLSAQEFYPLEVGNRWVYAYWSEPSTYDTVAVEAFQDSLFPNGHRYFVLDHPDVCGGTFVSADSEFVYYFDVWDTTDVAFLKLDDTIGSQRSAHLAWYYFVTLQSVDTISLFGVQTRVLTYYLDGLMTGVVRLSDRFGPMTEWFYGDPAPPYPIVTRNLVGCALSDSVYGYILDVRNPAKRPVAFDLYQNRPNPFNPTTVIDYEQTNSGTATLRIHNALGHEVRTLVKGYATAGRHQVTWDGTDNRGRRVGSGVYFYTLRASGTSLTRKMTFLK